MLKGKFYTNWLLCIIIASAVIYAGCAADKNSKKQTEESVGLSKDLIRANELTQSLYNYREMVATKKMTQEESARLSEPIKEELVIIRARLSKEELMYNDSISQVMGDVMANKLMKWRDENLMTAPAGN